jgi:hypothetical protein
MSKRDLAELACRFLALAVLVWFTTEIIVVPVEIVGHLFDRMRGIDSEVGAFLLQHSLSAVLHLAVVTVLWTHARWIATKIAPDDDDAHDWPHVRVVDLQIAAFSTVGVLSLVYGAAWFAYSLGAYLDSRYSLLGMHNNNSSKWLTSEGLLSALAYTALGLWLVVGSRNIVRFVRRMRQPNFRNLDEP